MRDFLLGQRVGLSLPPPPPPPRSLARFILSGQLGACLARYRLQEANQRGACGLSHASPSHSWRPNKALPRDGGGGCVSSPQQWQEQQLQGQKECSGKDRHAKGTNPFSPLPIAQSGGEELTSPDYSNG